VSVSTVPRIPPGTTADIGRVNAVIVGVLGRVGGASNIFATLARHRRMFRPWLRFAGRLMPFGKLPRRETELVILRVAHNCDCAYELAQHERIARRAGLSAEEISRAGVALSGFAGRDALVLRAADELHASRVISDELWSELRDSFSEVELIELCMLVGHYEMLAMTLNSLRVQVEGAR
jgi:AhpD family alkylhydroperoxidase